MYKLLLSTTAFLLHSLSASAMVAVVCGQGLEDFKIRKADPSFSPKTEMELLVTFEEKPRTRIIDFYSVTVDERSFSRTDTLAIKDLSRDELMKAERQLSDAIGKAVCFFAEDPRVELGFDLTKMKFGSTLDEAFEKLAVDIRSSNQL